MAEPWEVFHQRVAEHAVSIGMSRREVQALCAVVAAARGLVAYESPAHRHTLACALAALDALAKSP